MRSLSICKALRLTSLLIQHNQSPDTSIFTLCTKWHGEVGVDDGERKQERVETEMRYDHWEKLQDSFMSWSQGKVQDNEMSGYRATELSHEWDSGGGGVA